LYDKGSTQERWASHPSATVHYFIIVGDVDVTVVVAGDGVWLTTGVKQGISDSQQIIFTIRKQRS